MATESSERCRLRGLRAGTLPGTAASGENMIISFALSMLPQDVVTTWKDVLVVFIDFPMLLLCPNHG